MLFGAIVPHAQAAGAAASAVDADRREPPVVHLDQFCGVRGLRVGFRHRQTPTPSRRPSAHDSARAPDKESDTSRSRRGAFVHPAPAGRPSRSFSSRCRSGQAVHRAHHALAPYRLSGFSAWGHEVNAGHSQSPCAAARCRRRSVRHPAATADLQTAQRPTTANSPTPSHLSLACHGPPERENRISMSSRRFGQGPSIRYEFSVPTGYVERARQVAG